MEDFTINSNSLNNNQQKFQFTSELILNSPNKKEIESIFLAIKPETSVEINERGNAVITRFDENTVKMNFFAVDFISLRAMISSYLRWIEAITSTINVIERND